MSIRLRAGMKVIQIVKPTRTIAKSYDEVGQMIAWEEGLLDDETEADFFQHLIDAGLVWQLQGCYGRRATELIDAGICTPRRF